MNETKAKYVPGFIKSAIKRCLEPHTFQMSQAGQDLWVFGEVFNEKRGGYFLDLGAHDGVFISNTYLLERRYNWTGVCVEANPDSFRKLKTNRKVTCVHACLDSIEGFVNFTKRDVMGGIVSEDTDNKSEDEPGEVIRIETKTLERVLIENNAPSEIDYLSIDIEGAEERVLGTFNFNNYRFKCMTIERPTEPLRALFKENGYVLVKDIPGLDCFYIHESMADQYLTNLFAFYRKKRLTMRWR